MKPSMTSWGKFLMMSGTWPFSICVTKSLASSASFSRVCKTESGMFCSRSTNLWELRMARMMVLDNG